MTLDNPLRAGEVEFPITTRGSGSRHAEREQPSLAPLPPHAAQTARQVQAQTDALLLQCYAPAAVLTTVQGDIVYISGKTGKYLQPAAGHATLSVFAMAREGLAGPLDAAFGHALRQHEAITLEQVQVGTNGGTQHVAVTIKLLEEPIALKGKVLIVFTDLPAPPARTANTAKAAAAGAKIPDAERDKLLQDLQQARAELTFVREDMQSSKEELKSTNEELQSTNEELQSTNEELTTRRKKCSR